ncbi:MAG: HAMP domain-containing histidine kinase [Gammaproteobacteria bacterium]|nr:HAMP domain-containing histidine kinase [Gammaproteobacteria bacterium]
MKNRIGLRRKLGKAFLLQAVAISVTAVLGVYAAGFVLEEVLIKQALRDEADYFWNHYEKEAQFSQPDTLNLTGYLLPAPEDSPVPPNIVGLGSGFHDLRSQADISVAYVSERFGHKLVLLFDGEKVRELSLFFGLLPLAAVLAVIYLLTWISYRLSRRAVSPVIWLAREVANLDPASPDPKKFRADQLPADVDREVLALSEALERFAGQLNEFVDRERNFTRDASHELRSPLTVIRLASDMLLSEQELSPPAHKSVMRIKNAVADMEELVDAFLLLARESGQGLSSEPVCVNDVVDEELERARLLFQDKPIEVAKNFRNTLVASASDKALSVVIGNLLRNAFSYTDQGRVEIEIADRAVTISDSGVGMTEDDVRKAFRPYFRAGERRRGGHGVGLTIVKRFADRFGWPVRIDSKPNAGTRVTVEFPEGNDEIRAAG